jgi:Flp pilus assembly protein TadG
MRIRTRGRYDERGAVAVEMALLLPLVLLLLFGVIEWGKVFSQVEVYNGMAREGARCASVQAGGVSSCSVYTSITGAVPAQGLYTPPSATAVKVTLRAPGSSTWNAAPLEDACVNNRGDDVTVGWDQPLTVDIPFFGTLTVTHPIQATFRCE